MSMGLRIFRTSKPTVSFGPVVGMSREDREFWRLRRERELQRAEQAAR